MIRESESVSMQRNEEYFVCFVAFQALEGDSDQPKAWLAGPCLPVCIGVSTQVVRDSLLWMPPVTGLDWLCEQCRDAQTQGLGSMSAWS